MLVGSCPGCCLSRQTLAAYNLPGSSIALELHLELLPPPIHTGSSQKAVLLLAALKCTNVLLPLLCCRQKCSIYFKQTRSSVDFPILGTLCFKWYLRSSVRSSSHLHSEKQKTTVSLLFYCLVFSMPSSYNHIL